MKFYVLSSQVSEAVARKLADELESHLMAAQESGKTFEEFYRTTPRTYCDDLLQLLPRRTLGERLKLFSIGFFFLMQWKIADGIRGKVTISLYDIIVDLLFSFSFVSLLWTLLRKSAFISNKTSFLKLFFAFVSILAIYVGLSISEQWLYPHSPRIELMGFPARILGSLGLAFIMSFLFFSIFKTRRK